MSLNLFIFNGHGCSIPLNLKIDDIKIPHVIKLKPNQYVIMYKYVCPLRGAFWIQEKMWELLEILTPIDFVTQIKTIKTDTSSEFFEYFGNSKNESLCPNLMLSTVDLFTEVLSSEIKVFKNHYLIPRMGIIKCPSKINDADIDLIKGTTRHLTKNHILDFIPFPKDPIGWAQINDEKNKLYKQLNFIQESHIYNSAKEKISFPKYNTELNRIKFNTLEDFIIMMEDNPFIIFCNVCRSKETIGQFDYRYLKDIKSKSLDNLLNELCLFPPQCLIKLFQSRENYLNASVAPFTPPVLPTVLPPVISSVSNLNNKYYKNKYLKYKQKYLNLLHS
jgi:hypothetical protein